MRWQPGQSGNPKGRPKSKPVYDEINQQFKTAAETGDGATLGDIVTIVRRKAAAGEPWAVQLLFDRYEGKVPQTVAGDDDLDPVTVRTIITGVPRNGD